MSKKDDEELQAAIGGMATVVAYILLAAVTVCLRAFVLQSLWGWFLTPVVWLPAPALGMCVGLTLLFGYLCREGSVAASQKTRGAWATLWIALLEGAVVWLMGWGIHLLA